MSLRGHKEAPEGSKRAFFTLGVGMGLLAVLAGGVGISQGRVRNFGGIEVHFILMFFPLVMLLVFSGSALLISHGDRHSQHLVIWLMSFLYGLQMLLAMVTMGILSDMITGIPVVSGLMFFALSRLVVNTPFKSQMGLRTALSLSESTVWSQIHRRFGQGLGLAAMAILLLAVTSYQQVAILFVAIGPIGAVLFGVLSQRSAAKSPPKPH